MRKLLSLLLLTTVIVNGCISNQINAQTVSNPNVVEVLYFHGKQRCITCNTIEKLTNEVLNTNFAKEVKDNKIILHIIDISKKENEKIADKYEVTWSSLILVKGVRTKNLTELGFTYAKNSPDVFKAGLKSEIEKLLK